jgi:ribonuclease D
MSFKMTKVLKILYAGDTDNRLFFDIWGMDILNVWDIYQAAQALDLPKFGLEPYVRTISLYKSQKKRINSKGPIGC